MSLSGIKVVSNNQRSFDFSASVASSWYLKAILAVCVVRLSDMIFTMVIDPACLRQAIKSIKSQVRLISRDDAVRMTC